MGIFTYTVQPELLTLLSSSSKLALSPLFRVHSDSQDAKAFIAVLPDTLCSDDFNGSSDAHITSLASRGASSHSQDLLAHVVPIRSSKGCIAGPVIHLQDPCWKSTYIQAGSRKGKEKERLGIELPWLGFQIRPLGKRAWGFDIGVIDARGVEASIRVSSTFDEASLDLNHTPPIIQLPLALPTGDNALTPWLHLNIHLPTLLSLFRTVKSVVKSPPNKKQKISSQPVPVPSATFGSVTFVRIYANCRVRRMWFSQDGENTLRALNGGAESEMGLYAAKMRDE